MCSRRGCFTALVFLLCASAFGEATPSFSDRLEAALSPVLAGELTPDQLDGLTAVFQLYGQELKTLDEERAGLSNSLTSERQAAAVRETMLGWGLGIALAAVLVEGLALAFK